MEETTPATKEPILKSPSLDKNKNSTTISTPVTTTTTSSVAANQKNNNYTNNNNNNAAVSPSANDTNPIRNPTRKKTKMTDEEILGSFTV